jgi:hypothetical protein
MESGDPAPLQVLAMQPFYGLKVSDHPITEWHALATIQDEDENGKINGFSVVV